MIQQLPRPIEFGKYTLFERLGRGGMADVYKGRIQGPEGFERIFVIKRILPHLSDDPTFIRMFIEEAKLSARLNHPNIVQIFELGAVEGEYFISMEYVHGQDLSATMRVFWKSVGPPHPALVAYVGRDVCRALGYAHGLTDEHGQPLGMIHRDVSPSNVMLSYDGAVKLLDFGIAKAMSDAPETTRNGTMKGKYAYMAPEQTERDNVDHRIDIFATGIVLYESLTGRRLFKGATDMQTIERVRRCDVKPPSFLNPACPPELDEILLKALARDPDRRFQTAGEMAEALDDLVHATRFTPDTLAGTLRHAFGLDGGASHQAAERRLAPGAPGATGSISTSASASSSASAPSPTIPPVARSQRNHATERSASGQPSPTGVGVGTPDAALIGTLLVKPMWTRASFWVTVVLCVVGVGFAVQRGSIAPGGGRGPAPGIAPGQLAGLSSTDRGAGGPQSAAAGRSNGSGAPHRVPVLLQSYPEGAAIFVTGRLETVGVTPMWYDLELDENNPPRVMFRKVGFEDKAIAVDSTRPATVELIANAPPAPAVVPSPAQATPGSGLDGARAHAARSLREPYRLMRVKLPAGARATAAGPGAAVGTDSAAGVALGAKLPSASPPPTATASAAPAASAASVAPAEERVAVPPEPGSPRVDPAPRPPPMAEPAPPPAPGALAPTEATGPRPPSRPGAAASPP